MKLTNNLQFVSAKDIMRETGCSEKTAYKLLKDIKEQYEIHAKVTMAHLIDYFKIPQL